MIGASSSIYGSLIGRHDYAIVDVPTRLPGLSRRLDGYTIVQLSDVHLGTFVGEPEVRAAEDLVRRARPDLLILTGDLIDHDPRYADLLGRFVRRLVPHARDGVVAIPGNHDYYTGIEAVRAAVTGAGAAMLVNDGRVIGDAAAGFALLGVDDLYGPRSNDSSPGPDLDRAIASVPADLPRVLLCHNPQFFPAPRGKVALQLSGHTHGGQINFGLPTARIVLGHRFIAGAYQLGGTSLYVNRGFGTAGPRAHRRSARGLSNHPHWIARADTKGPNRREQPDNAPSRHPKRWRWKPKQGNQVLGCFMAAKLGGTFLIGANGPVSYAGQCILSSRVADGLRELTPESLYGGFRRGVEESAKRVGVGVTEVERLLPMEQVRGLISRITVSHRNAVEAWNTHAGHIGGFLKGVADLTADGRAPDVGLCLDRLAKKVARDRELADPLRALAVDVGEWQAIVARCRDLLDDGGILERAYRMRRVRRALLIAGLGAVIVAALGSVLWVRARACGWTRSSPRPTPAPPPSSTPGTPAAPRRISAAASTSARASAPPRASARPSPARSPACARSAPAKSRPARKSWKRSARRSRTTSRRARSPPKIRPLPARAPPPPARRPGRAHRGRPRPERSRPPLRRRPDRAADQRGLQAGRPRVPRALGQRRGSVEARRGDADRARRRPAQLG